jgi:hypothetical protein
VRLTVIVGSYDPNMTERRYYVKCIIAFRPGQPKYGGSVATVLTLIRPRRADPTNELIRKTDQRHRRETS